MHLYNRKGQILIILALAMVALLGVAALAIDGSMVYKVRRQDKALADSAALAGANYIANNITTASCDDSNFKTAVASAANAFASSATIAVTCGTDASGKAYWDVQTTVNSTVKSYFLKVITNKPNSTTVVSVARVYPGSTKFAGGNAIYTTGTSCSESDSGGGVFVSGGGSVINITGGGLYSFSCLSTNGNTGTSGRILARNGKIQYSGTAGSQVITVGSLTEYIGGNGLKFGYNSPEFILNEDPDRNAGYYIDSTLASVLSSSYREQLINGSYANANIDQSLWPVPTTASASTPQIKPAMTMASCTGGTQTVPSQVTGGSPYHLKPGVYSSIYWNGWGGETLIFDPGAYCVTGSVTISGGVDTIKTDTVGNKSGVTIYIKQGDFTISGAEIGYFNAPAPSTSDCSAGPSICGVLLYMDSGKISIVGSSTLTMTGTVYAPNSPFYVTGNSGAQALNVQIIAKMVSVQGSSTINMNQTSATLYSQGSSSTISLYR